MKVKTILVCGGRDFVRYSLLRNTIENIINEIWLGDENEEEDETHIRIIAGETIGADFLAKVFALDEFPEAEGYNVSYKGFPANWKKYGREAGSIRNQQMLDEGKPDLVVAFPGGSGTADMVRRARQAGVEVIKVG